MGSVKEQAIQAIQGLPEDTEMAEIIERLYLLHKVQRGIKQADAGQVVSQEEARERMARWLR